VRNRNGLRCRHRPLSIAVIATIVELVIVFVDGVHLMKVSLISALLMRDELQALLAGDPVQTR